MDSEDDFESSALEEDKPEPTGPYNPERETELVRGLHDMVQYPNPGLIRYADLVWLPHATIGNHGKVESKIAAISWDRLQDFVEGQEQNPEYPAKFNRHVKKKHPPGSLVRPQAFSAAQLIRYQCCFGPKDQSNVVPEDVQAVLDSTVKKRKKVALSGTGKRRGKKVVPEYDVFPTTQPSQGKQKRKRVGKLQTGRSIKRGCQCCFFAKQLYQDPTICQLIYRYHNHTNKEGQVVHGVSISGFKDSLGSALSTEMKAHLTNLLWLGLSPSQVMAQHKTFVKNLAAENGEVSRDTFVQAQDVRNLAKTRDKALWQRHQSDPESVKMWVDENPDSVFCYRQHGKLDLNRKKQDDTPFTLGIQTPWQLEMLLKCGHNSALSIDATFSTSETRYPLYTVMVFDEWRNGIPVAFFVISQCRERDLEWVLLKLHNKVLKEQPSWTPTSIIVDNAQAEINVLRKIWPNYEIFLCLWHVRKNWRENAVKKISTVGERAYVLNALGNIMYGNGFPIDCNPVLQAQQELDALTAEWKNAARFMKYMNKHWRSKAGMWCLSNRAIPHAGQNTNAAIESYHGNLKSILKSSRERFDGRRLDWLIFHLVGDVVTHYWYAVHCKLFGFVRNRNQEGIVATAIVRAQNIPDSSVRIYPNGEDIALVASTNHAPKIWTIYAPDSEWAQCDCPVGLQGMICKHTMKVFKVLHPEVSDGLLLKEAGTTHGVEKDVPLSQCFHPQEEVSQVVHNEFPEQNFMMDTIDTVLTEKTPNTMHKGEQSRPKLEDPKVAAGKVFCSLLEGAAEHPRLFDFLLADLKNARGKQVELVARGLAGVDQNASKRVFDEAPGDNSLKRYKSFLESKSRKVPAHGT